MINKQKRLGLIYWIGLIQKMHQDLHFLIKFGCFKSEFSIPKKLNLSYTARKAYTCISKHGLTVLGIVKSLYSLET